ncbi:hypothetical protein Gpo141_00009388 [Globisporangium polare]
MGSAQAALRTVVTLLSLWLCILATNVTLAQSSNSTTNDTSSNATATNSTTQYLRMTWAETDIVRVTFAEPFLNYGIKSFLQNASSVRVIDIREPAFPIELPAATRSTFQVLFMVTMATNSTKTNTTSTNGTVQGFQSDALVKYLQQNLTTPSDGSAAGDAGYNTSAASWTATFFPTVSIKFALLSTADVQALGPFPALTQLSTPSASNNSSNTSFMTLDVVFRNIHSAANLTRGLIYQARQGIARFLQLPGITEVYAAGPAQVPANAALQVVQRYYLVLARNGSQSNSSNLTTPTMENRERLANLLRYGDPTREVADFEANDGYFATMRASMFFDYILPANASLPPLSLSGATDTALEVSMMEALFSYAFSSLTVNQFPAGNPPAPSSIANATNIIPAVSNDVLMSKMRKRQLFLYDASFAFANTSGVSTTPGSNLQYPSVIQSNASSSCTMVNGFCTYIYWKNSLTSTFWLESMESVNQVAWNLFPTVPFFAVSDPVLTPTSLLAPIVTPGNTSTPIWTFGALSGPSNRLDFALNLRNADDNATALKVEISTDVRSSVEATSTITSIARNTRGSFGSPSNASQPPIFETKSNIVVTYQSRFRNANEMFLFLEIKNSSATTKDTSQPCAHCQNLYEWCASQPKCAALSSCVFLQGIDRDQIPYQMLSTSPLQDVRELWPYFQNCMGPLLTTDSNDLKALLLLSNAVRCQMQRLCPFRTTSYYGGAIGDGSDSKILIWESVEGQHQLKTPSTNVHFPRDVPVNVSLRLGSQVLCYLPILSNTTADSLEDRITRNCKLAKYLGRVSVSVNMTGTTTNASANSYDSIVIRYKYIVGPLPTLEIVPASVNASSFNGTTVSAEIATLAFPGIRLRLETKDFQSILPPAPATAPLDPCTKCNTLALDVCLRDLTCVAFTDCIMRYPMDNSTVPPVGDVILDAFRTQAIGQQISLSSAIDACHSSTNVNQLEWRKLVNASACLSKNACPISMQMLVPSSEKLVGKWRIDPVQKLQKLLYQQQASDAAASNLQVPLVLVRNSEVVKADSSSVADPRELEVKLQKLLEYDDLSVEIEFDKLQSDSGLRTIQWSITYSHWIGSLPRFLPDTSSPQWTLFTYPTPQQDFYLEVLNKTALALAAGNGTLSNMATVPV